MDWLLGLTEPDHGSDPGSMATRAYKGARRLQAQGQQDVDHQQPHGRRVRGLGQGSHPKAAPVGPIRGFVLEKGMKGLSAPAIHGKVGLRASITGEIVMDDVFVPEENAFPEVRA